jgi:capsular exopolysaccharide synthesis family protein
MPSVQSQWKTVLKIKKPCASYEKYLHLLTSDPEIELAYQALLDSFYLQKSDRPLKTLLVTSAQPEEGKTTVTVMVALTAMIAGLKVLLVDADLRKPRVHDIFHLDNKVGLRDLLTGTVGIAEVLQVVVPVHDSPRKTPTVGVITSGTTGSANTMLTMGSPKLKTILDQTAQQFDLVLLDSPPALSVNDPLFLADAVDGVILVVACGLAKECDAKLAKERIQQAGGQILGVVINKFVPGLHGQGFHPYRGYYE